MFSKPRRKRIVYILPEDKIKAVERILSEHIPTRQMVEEMNVSQTSIQQWGKKYKDHGPQSFLKKGKKKESETTVEVKELECLKEIEAAYKEQQVQVEILKQFQTFLEQNSVYYEDIKSSRQVYTGRQLAEASGVSSSGYYAHLKRPEKGPIKRNLEDKKMIQTLYDRMEHMVLSELQVL